MPTHSQLVDLGAANGTKVNGRQLDQSERVQLAQGDTVQFGASTRTYIVRMARMARAPVPQVERYPEPVQPSGPAKGLPQGDMPPPAPPASTQDQHLVDEAAAMAALMPDVAAQFKIQQDAETTAPPPTGSQEGGSEAAEASSASTFTAFKKPNKAPISIGLSIGKVQLGADSVSSRLTTSSGVPPPNQESTNAAVAADGPSSTDVQSSHVDGGLAGASVASTPLYLPPPTAEAGQSSKSAKGVKAGETRAASNLTLDAL